MIRPIQHEERYFNRKKNHSRNVQIVCDIDMNILSVDATFGDATHDSFIFNQHPMKNYLSYLVSRGETIYLLGDSSYAQRKYMMTPIVNAKVGSPEEYYTKQHSSARHTIERTIGLLKARWRCLLRHSVHHYDPQTVAKIINACCVLHNLCNIRNCVAPSIPDEERESYTEEIHENNILPISRNDELMWGQAARQRLIETLWRNRH